jgi:hypothetical protein
MNTKKMNLEIMETKRQIDLDKIDIHAILERLRLLEERVQYLESQQVRESAYDFEETLQKIEVTDFHLAQVIESNMEDQIISILVNHNKQYPFLKMCKHLCMFKEKWVFLTDADFKLMIETIEYKLLKIHQKQTESETNADNYFEVNKIMYGLNFAVRCKKIKVKLIEGL